MKTFTILFYLFLIILFQTSVFSQNPYYDAIKLNGHTDSDGEIISNITTYQILKNYVDKEDPTGTELDKIFDDPTTKNPFIVLAGGTKSKKTFSKNNQTLASKGGLNVTNIADGLAKFLVERTKQELSITFFQKFKDILDKPEYKDFKTLFPDTYKALEVIDDEIYQFSHYINTLRETFDKDLQNMVTNLEPFLNEKKVNLYMSDPDDKIAQKIEYFESALTIINNIRQGLHPAEAVGKLEYNTYHVKNTALLQIQEGVKVFNIFSNSLKSNNADKYWISSNELQEILDTNTFKIYLGLLYQLHGTDIINGQPFSFYLDQVANSTVSIDSYKEFVKNFIRDGEQIVLAVQGIKQKKTNGDDIDSYKDLFLSTIGFLRNLKSVDALNIGLNITTSDKVWDVLDMANSIYLDVNERKYNALILDLSALLTEILESTNFTWNDELIKYGTFIANVAQADTSEEVKSAIEAVALPVGSATIKKRSIFNVALNGYVGVSPALEYNGETNEDKFSLGINAPVGIAVSWGITGKKNNGKRWEGGSISIFATIVDLGAVTNFRFNDNQTEELPEFKFENILAPGGYLVYGLPKIPISIGVGFQLGPQLREITAMEATIDADPNYSFRAFIAVDIPLLNFYTRSR